MELLLKVTRFFKASWAADQSVPPYPLTCDEWAFILQDCREREVEKALKKELVQVRLEGLGLAGQ